MALVVDLFQTTNIFAKITAVVRQRQPRHVIACIGGNNLGKSDPGWNADILITRLVTFLSKLIFFNLQKDTVLNIFPRRISEAQRFYRQQLFNFV